MLEEKPVIITILSVYGISRVNVNSQKLAVQRIVNDMTATDCNRL